MDKMYDEVKQELTEDILPFWINHTVDWENGGFYGYISRDMKIMKEAEKSSVLTHEFYGHFRAAFITIQSRNIWKLQNVLIVI